MYLIIIYSLLIFCTLVQKKVDKILSLWCKVAISILFSVGILGSSVLVNLELNINYLKADYYFLQYVVFITHLAFFFIFKNKDHSLNINFKNIYLSIKNSPNILKIYLLLIVIASIGPINHPDASDYHVGAAYQNFINGYSFNKDFLTLGITGIGDWINILFLYEKNTWLIRPLNALIFIPLVFYLYENKINLWMIFLFLSMPVIIQWISIGKPIFIVEACLGILTIHFYNKPSKSYLIRIIYASLFSIAFKLTSAITVMIIILAKIISFKKIKFVFNNINSLDLLKVFFVLLLSANVFYLRYTWFDNPFFPFLDNFFNIISENRVNFLNSIMSYNKLVWYWPIRVFIPLSTSEIGMVAGPVSLIVFLCITFLIFQQTKKFKFKDINLLFLGWLLFLFILLFSQPRADYFVFPFILFIFSSKFIKFQSVNLYFFKTLKFLIFSQLIVTTLILIISIYQTILTIQNYEKAMNNYAYGYEISKVATKLKEPVLINNIRQTRLYFNMQYVDRDKYTNCTFSNDKLTCIDKLNINSIIVGKSFINNTKINEKKNWDCKLNKTVNLGRRNFLSSKKKIFINLCERR